MPDHNRIPFLEASMRYARFKQSRTASRFGSVFFCVAVFLLAMRGNAQIAGAGNIQGTVADPSGAVVPNATVTATDSSTQVKHITRSDKSGVYVFPGLPVGNYNLDVAAPGFQTYEQTGIVLEVGSSIAVNVSLAVGRQDIKVEVHAEGLALQTEDASFKQTVDEQDITEMPLNGRQM